jgi:hypothetical protein
MVTNDLFPLRHPVVEPGTLPRRLIRARVVVDVRLPPVFLVHVPVRDVNMIEGRMVVVVRVGGKQMAPVFSLVQVVRHVIVLVPVLQGLVLVMTLLLRHPAHHLFSYLRSPMNRPYTERWIRAKPENPAASGAGRF